MTLILAMEAVYSTTEKDRTFFVADLSRLRQEGDTLVNAMVVYSPEADLKRAVYEQRCSQLVGLALCTMNFTGWYPDYLRLRSTGFAIRALGQHYIMGLQGRHDEPKEGTVECLNAIHDCFRFYYHSPAAVLKTSQGDWEIFTCHMSSIFSLILQHMSGDKHSVQAMFSTLPYSDPAAWGRDGPRLFLLASRVLRACQQHFSIIGGCITHTKDASPTSPNSVLQAPISKIVCSQFPPVLTEKLVLAGGQGVELNSKSIVEDNITPDKVWVIEVYLTSEEGEAADDQRKDLSALQSTYASLDNNPQLASVQFPGPRIVRQRGQWRKKSPSHRRKSPSLALLSRSTSPTKKPPEEAVYEEIEEDDLNELKAAPVASSTPNPKPKSASLKSEDAIQINPEEGSVTYNPQKKKSILKTSSALGKPPDDTPKRTALAFRPLPPIPSDANSTDFTTRINIYADDCVDSIFDTASNAFHTPPTQPHQMTTTAEDRGIVAAQPIQSAANRDSDGDAAESRPSTASSEGFATPSPTLPGDYNFSHAQQQKKGFGGSSGLLALSGDTDRSSLFQSARETSLPLTREEGQELETSSKRSTLTHKDADCLENGQDQAPEVPPRLPHPHPNSSTRGQPALKVTAPRDSPPKLPPKPPNALPSGPPRPPPVDTQPAILRNWRFRAHPASESDDDSDFVSSTELQHMLMENKHAFRKVAEDKDRGEEEDRGEDESDTRAAESSSKLTEDCSVEDSAITNGGPAPTQEHAVEEPDTQASTQSPAATLTNGDLSQRRSESPPPVTAKSGGGLTDVSEHSDDHSVEARLGSATEASVNGDQTNGDTETLPGKGEDDVYDDIIVLRSQVAATDMEPSPANGIPEPEESAVQSGDVERTEKEAEELPDTKLGSVPENGMVEIESARLDVVEQTTTDGGTSVDGPEDEPDDDAAGGDIAATDGPVELDKGTSVDGPEFEIARSSSSLLSSGKTLVNEVADRLAPLNNVEESMLSEMDVRYNANESISAGLMTPVEMTLTEATINASKLEDSGEYSSLPEDEGEEEEGEGEGLDVQSKLGHAATLRTRTGSWVHKTLERQPADKPAPQLEKKCLYVQRYMNTVITLLADEGLNQEQDVLHSLWQSLLPQLYELDVGLKKGDEAERQLLAIKPHNSIAIYSATERKCEALPNTAIYHVRHAFRRAHQEYLKDPSILQIGLSKEHVRMLSQRVMDREVYFNPGRMGHVDALSILSAIERYAKVKQGPWQEKLLLIS